MSLQQYFCHITTLNLLKPCSSGASITSTNCSSGASITSTNCSSGASITSTNCFFASNWLLFQGHSYTTYTVEPHALCPIMQYIYTTANTSITVLFHKNQLSQWHNAFISHDDFFHYVTSRQWPWLNCHVIISWKTLSDQWNHNLIFFVLFFFILQYFSINSYRSSPYVHSGKQFVHVLVFKKCSLIMQQALKLNFLFSNL